MTTSKKSTNNNVKRQAAAAKAKTISKKQAEKLPAQDPERIEFYLKWLGEIIKTFDDFNFDNDTICKFGLALENSTPEQRAAFKYGLKLLRDRVGQLYSDLNFNIVHLQELLFADCESDPACEELTNCGALEGYHPTEEESARARELYGDD